MRAAILRALWEVCDASKTHVSFAHARVVHGTHRKEAVRSLEALAEAVDVLSLAERSDEAPDEEEALEAHWQATADQQAALTIVGEEAKRYSEAATRHAAKGDRRVARDNALVALCKALDIATFYRNGPVARPLASLEAAQGGLIATVLGDAWATP